MPENSQPIFDAEDMRRHLQEAAGHVSNLADQNRRFGLLPEVTDPDLKAVAAEWLAVEQQNTLSYLQANADTVAYEQLGQRTLDLESAQQLAKEQKRHEVDSLKEAVDKAAELVIQIAPLGEEETRRLAQEKKQALDEQLENFSPPAELAAEKLAVDSLFELISDPWPVPRAASLEAIKRSNREIVREIIDEMPTEPTLVNHSEMSTNGRKDTHNIYERELTSKIISFLAGNHGRVISVRELCESMYSPEVLGSMSREQARNLITTALGPKVKGPVVRKALQEKGYTLQYGRRIERIRDNGRTQTKIKRIYRVIPLEEFNEAHTERSDNDTILWELTPDQVELLESKRVAAEAAVNPDLEESISGKRRFEQVAELLIGSPDRHFTYEDVGKILYPGEEVDSAKMRNRLAVMFKQYGELIEESMAARGFALQKEKLKRPGYKKKVMVLSANPLESDEARTITPPSEPAEPEAAPASDGAGPTEAKPAAAKKPERKNGNSWEDDFKGEVEAAITQLSSQGYIQGGNLFPLLESRGNGSATTLINHMHKEGVLSKTKLTGKVIRSSDLIAFSVSRGNRSLFRNEALKARCMEIISASLSRHYAKQQAEVAAQTA